MFKPARSDSRFPAFLQPYTKENYIAQVAATVVLIVGFEMWSAYQIRKFNKENPISEL